MGEKELELGEIDLREIMYIIGRRLWLIILITMLSISTSGVISFFVLNPIYQASTTVMVGKPVGYSEGIQLQDLNLNQRLAKTYGQIIKSRGVSEVVIDQMNLNITPDQLMSKTSVSQISDTEFIKIKVTDTDPVKAANIANKLSVVFKSKVMEIMKVDHVQVLDYAIPPESSIKPRPMLNMMIAGVLGVMVSLFLVFLLEYMDNTIKTAEDIKKHLKLNVIGTIPIIKEEK